MERADFLRESIDFLNRFVMKSFQKEAEEQGFTIPQARVIGYVFIHQPVSIKQLSRNLKMTQSTASDIVERLVAKDFLIKTPNAKDKRIVDISLSPELAEEITESSILEIVNTSLIDALNRLNEDEQKIVEEGMRLLVTAVKEKMAAEGMDNYEYFNISDFLGGANHRE
ncbi:MarR family winged helix-turn-helix transcriptional regulator [Camelliibacillus cellulosilyticus]|uniref:MarR family winged helix-turn-helix transcriptional regulator n=1 Tax=Camelliibacillus cellulosilyticus TaxID=2174486 RepID=A0ABV9GQL0_9BACL